MALPNRVLGTCSARQRCSGVEYMALMRARSSDQSAAEGLGRVGHCPAMSRFCSAGKAVLLGEQFSLLPRGFLGRRLGPDRRAQAKPRPVPPEENVHRASLRRRPMPLPPMVHQRSVSSPSPGRILTRCRQAE
jgi:hypothetical protein